MFEAQSEDLLSGIVVEEVNEENQEQFMISDDSKADLALEKLRELTARKKEKEELAAERKLMIDRWLSDETSKIDTKIEYFEDLLADYARMLKERDPKLKTYSLPFGKLKFRKQKPKWKYEEDKLLRFLKLTGIDAIKVKEKVDKQALKNMVKIVGNKVVHTETGEVIDGVEIEERGEIFSIDI
ncbi:host-nuclease inhibitor Gam family protein [Orenia marismortui]|uniref:Gam-like protein n=1 Tax=Orenia marismortui TaxID=46469 RepID=A0A4R8H6E8_9FIRM|nr:host-nuclease inhibitor Gam family protein [Orenia marismortui]TDX53156.1 Gam-like protein [Orenia marismortui]